MIALVFVVIDLAVVLHFQHCLHLGLEQVDVTKWSLQIILLDPAARAVIIVAVAAAEIARHVAKPATSTSNNVCVSRPQATFFSEVPLPPRAPPALLLQVGRHEVPGSLGSHALTVNEHFCSLDCMATNRFNLFPHLRFAASAVARGRERVMVKLATPNLLQLLQSLVAMRVQLMVDRKWLDRSMLDLGKPSHVRVANGNPIGPFGVVALDDEFGIFFNGSVEISINDFAPPRLAGGAPRPARAVSEPKLGHLHPQAKQVPHPLLPFLPVELFGFFLQRAHVVRSLFHEPQEEALFLGKHTKEGRTSPPFFTEKNGISPIAVRERLDPKLNKSHLSLDGRKVQGAQLVRIARVCIHSLAALRRAIGEEFEQLANPHLIGIGVIQQFGKLPCSCLRLLQVFLKL